MKDLRQKQSIEFWPKTKKFKTETEMANALDKITQGVGQQMGNKALVIVYDKEGFSISNGHKEFSRSENINCVVLLRNIADKMEEDRIKKDDLKDSFRTEIKKACDYDHRGEQTADKIFKLVEKYKQFKV